MRVVIDAMGGDNAPVATVKGAVEAVKSYNIDVILAGNEPMIEEQLAKYDHTREKIEIVHCNEIITNEDKPVSAIREKRDSSMVAALKLVKEKRADAIVSAGNTGALLAGGLLILGRIKGIDRPALAPPYPTVNGMSVLIDGGANSDCKPRNLLEFGIMGSVYAEKVLEIKKPSVCIVNIGIEEEKGSEIVKEAHKLCKIGPFNFKGNIEARDIPAGYADVIVCDGFTGNVILKLTEGLADSIFRLLKEEFVKNPLRKIGASLLKSGLKDFKGRFDYTEYGGAPFLGVKGVLIKAHGSSDAKAVKNAIKQGIKFIENDVIDDIAEKITGLGEDIIE
ncbi:MAG: phosphate acyltransferase PlsX [Alkaliphilus sp.]|nr:phosphate acyltransferase PlsX [Alkaliphilus sp.]